jgi:hypothetical protein
LAYGVTSTADQPVPQNTKDQPKVVHPGMMGAGTEEQNLNEKGSLAARINTDEVETAFEKQPPRKS